LVIHIAHS
jgi:hypothetical protein